jgi:protein-S-isoprenylcysteine O-methyltransferase Ste14
MHLKIPPLILAAIFAGLMALASQWPVWWVQIPAQKIIGLLLAVGGILLVASGVQSFRKAKTTVNPRSPGQSSALVVIGLYRYTRNPMYLGFFLLLCSLGIYQSLILNLILGPSGFVAYMNKFQIRPEEEALQKIYGEEFIEYKKRVRRWI